MKKGQSISAGGEEDTDERRARGRADRARDPRDAPAADRSSGLTTAST